MAAPGPTLPPEPPTARRGPWGACSLLPLLAIGLAALVASAGGIPRAERGTDAPRPGATNRLVVLGIDGLDHRLLAELARAGRLPTFAKLLRSGAHGTVRASDAGVPPLSPRIWTTYATGQLPEVHGITGFTYQGQDGKPWLFTSDKRRSPALWEIATQAGRRVGVVNWWFTYPAEEVRGFVISDRYLENIARRQARFYRGEAEWDGARLLFPKRLVSALAGVDAKIKTWALTPQAAERIDRTILDLARAGRRFEDPDILLIYTRALDELSHMRWASHVPEARRPGEQDAIVAYLERYDAMLAELLAGLAPGTRLAILSDHGFEWTGSADAPSGEHKTRESADAATILLHGPGVRAGADLGEVPILDVLPTLLALAHIPASEKMPGQVVTAAFADAAGLSLERVPSYVRKAGVPSGATDADPDTIERLRALGYLE